MATDHNFRIKNGLEVGGQLIVNSSGQLVVADVTSNLDFADNIKARFGNGADLQIYHDASDSIILDNGTGNLKIQANDLVLKNADGSKEYLKGTNGGSVRIRHNNTIVLETTSTGIEVDGPHGNATIGAQNTTGLHIYTDRDRFYFNKITSHISNSITSYDDDFNLQRQASTKLTLTSTGASVTGDLSVSGDLNITGDINSVSVTDLDVVDKTITVGQGQSASNSTGSGLVVSGANANILWDNTDDRWEFNKDIFTTGALEIGNSRIYKSGDSNHLHFDVPTAIIGSSTTTSSNPSIGTSAYRFSGVYSSIGSFSGDVTVGGDIYAKDSNSTTDPSITFSGHTDSGLSMSVSGGNDQLSVITDGVRRAIFNNAGITSSGNVYTGNASEFRNYGGTWKATTGATGNGFQFINSVDGTALTLSSTGNASFAGNIVTTSSSAVIQTPRISMEADGTLDWGSSKNYGTLTWDTNKAILKGQAGSSLELQVNNSTVAVAFNTSGDATFGGDVQIGTTAPQTNASLNLRRNGANIEFGHGNRTSGYYGTLGAFYNNGQPYLGFSADANESGNTFNTRGFKGNIIFGDTSGNLIFSQLTNANATGQTPTERLRINSSGNATFAGTISSDAITSTVVNTGDATLLTLHHDTGADLSTQQSFIDFSFEDDNTNETPQVRIGAQVGQNANADSQAKEGSGAFVVYTNNADTDSGAAGTSLAERMRVDYRGYVGIGTSTPTHTLHVAGDIRINNGSALKLYNSAGNGWAQIAYNNTLDHIEVQRSFQSATDSYYNLGSSGKKWLSVYSDTIKASNGTNGAPTYTFDGDTDTGMYRGSSNSLQFSTGGVMRLNLDSSGHSNFTGETRTDDWFQVNSSSSLLKVNITAWSTHAVQDVLRNSYNSTIGDFLTIKASGNGADSHGAVVVSDNIFAYGRTDKAAATAASLTAPFATNSFQVTSAGNATFAGDVNANGSILGDGNLFLRSYNNDPKGIFFRDGFEYGDSNQYNLSITVFDDGDASADAMNINAYDGIYFNVQSGTTPSTALKILNSEVRSYKNFVSTGTVTATGGNSTQWNTAYGWGNYASAPNAPSITSTTVVNETIEIVFGASTSTGNTAATSYEVWSDGGTGTDYSLIAKIPYNDIASSMSVVDSSFDDSGTIAYRVYAIRHGAYSTAATTTRTFSMPTLDVSNMSVIPDTNNYYIQYELPTTRFLDHVEIYKDVETTSSALSRTGAALVYSGNNASYKYNISSSDMDKYHQFWVEVVTV